MLRLQAQAALDQTEQRPRCRHTVRPWQSSKRCCFRAPRCSNAGTHSCSQPHYLLGPASVSQLVDGRDEGGGCPRQQLRLDFCASHMPTLDTLTRCTHTSVSASHRMELHRIETDHTLMHSRRCSGVRLSEAAIDCQNAALGRPWSHSICKDGDFQSVHIAVMSNKLISQCVHNVFLINLRLSIVSCCDVSKQAEARQWHIFPICLAATFHRR